MRKRQWSATLMALGLVGVFGSSISSAQTMSRPATPTFPYNLPPAPLPAASPVSTTPVAGPALPAAGPLAGTIVQAPPLMAPAPPVRTTVFADPQSAPPMPAPPMTIPGSPVPASVTPMPGSTVGPTPAAIQTSPALPPTGTTPGSAPATTDSGGAPPLVPAAATDQIKFTFKPGDEHLLNWDYGNGLFKFYVGGRLQIDAVWYRGDDALTASRTAGGIGRLDDATNFRRARFEFGGTFYKNIEFLMQWDFINTFNAERTGNTLAANTPAPTDMWVTFKDVPWLGNVRIGNQKPPISFEHLTSSRFLNFMERSLGFDAFVENQNNGFEMGISAYDTYADERGTWAVGVFKNTRGIFGWNVGDGEYDVTARITGLPIYESDGATLVHLGLGASHRDLDDDVDRIRARTELRNGPAVLHNIVAEVQTLGSSRTQVNPEFVVVYGPWTLQSEYQRVWVADATTPFTGNGPRTNHGTAQYQAGYAELLYFLTGEHRYYNRKTAVFGRVTPNENFTGFGMGDDCTSCGGLGAWQIGARYSWIDLDNAGIQGGTVHDVTLGLNWFLNPYMKWQWNVEALYRNAPNQAHDGWAYGFGTRIAFDF